VLIAWATVRPAPLPELARPARSRIPAITGAAPAVLIVVASGERPLRRICFPAIFGMPVGGALLGMPVDRAQQRVDVDEHPWSAPGSRSTRSRNATGCSRAALTRAGGRDRR
jgi:hypothetical protein